jgi:hypothetical protein
MKANLTLLTFTGIGLLGAFAYFVKPATPVAVVANSVANTVPLTTNVTTQDVVDLANIFKATLTTSQVSTLELSYTFAHAKTWSNLPAAMSARLGLKMGNLSASQLTAARNLIAAISGTGNEGYAEIYGLWMADNYLEDNGGGATYGEGNFYIAFFGTPSLTGTFEVQMTGHHRTVSNTYINGVLVGGTPSFVATEPYAAFTENGVSYQPMVEEKTALVNMLTGLTPTQRTSAQLSSTFTDIVCGPNHDWAFPTTKVGLKASNLDGTQKALIIDAIATYTDDLDDTSAATVLALYESEINDTYIAWATDYNLNNQNGYVRIDGPHVWIEYSTQNGIILSPKHPHSIWRDHITDYGGTGNTTAGVDNLANSLKAGMYPNPVEDFTTFNFTLKDSGKAVISVYDLTGKQVSKIEKTNMVAGINAVTVNLSHLQSGTYLYTIQSNGITAKGDKFIKK